jgi:hypothetical protein
MTRTIVIGTKRSGLDGCEENYSTPKIALVYEMNISRHFLAPNSRNFIHLPMAGEFSGRSLSSVGQK